MGKTFSHGKSFFQGRHYKPAGKMHGCPVRQEITKKEHFSQEERVLLGNLTYRSAFGQEHLRLVAKSVFGMKKAEIEQAIERLGRMPIALNDIKTLNLVGSLGGKLQERLEKIRADEQRQQQKRNQ